MNQPRPNTVVEVAPPPGSRAEAFCRGTDFHDAWAVQAADGSRSALGQFLASVSRTPAWVDACMALRNRAVRLVGLKDVGALGHVDPAKPAEAYRPGDRVGIFTLRWASFDEAVLGIEDSHLDVHLSVHRAPSADGRSVQVTVTTAVKVHRLLGHLYMLPVKPMHRIVAPAVLRRVAHVG